MEVGLIVRSGWRAEIPTARDPAEAFDDMVASARDAVRAGARSVWVYDHLEAVPTDSNAPCFEAWTTLATLASRIDSIRLGPLVSGISLRNVGLLAKMAATVDVASKGRLVLGLGAGWYRDELRHYGYSIEPFRVRVASLAAAVDSLRALWRGEKTTTDTPTLRGAVCQPGPLRGEVPVWIGGGSEPVLRVAAAKADGVNLSGSPAQIVQTLMKLKEFAEDEERERPPLEVSVEVHVLLEPSAGEVERSAAQLGLTVEEFHAAHIAGDARLLRERVAALRDAGVDVMTVFVAGTVGSEATAEIIGHIYSGANA